MKKLLLTLSILATASTFWNATAADEAEKTVVAISANDQMKFDIDKFEVPHGQIVELTLTNAGTLPKAAMGHNVVILAAETDMQAFLTKAMAAAATDYVPADAADSILAHTKLLGPGEKDTITFRAPEKEGAYDFLCSFPGHAMVAMKGKMIVK